MVELRLAVILPAFFGVLSIVSALWPRLAMQVTLVFCQLLLKVLGLEGTLTISPRAVTQCRLFNLCMIPVNGVLLWLALRAG